MFGQSAKNVNKLVSKHGLPILGLIKKKNETISVTIAVICMSECLLLS